MITGLLGMLGCAGDRPQNPGPQNGLLLACPSSPNCVSSQAADEGHRIAPLMFSGDPDAAFARLKQVLGRRGDTTIIEEKPGYLRVELRTTLFVDDGEFLLDRSALGHPRPLRLTARLFRPGQEPQPYGRDPQSIQRWRRGSHECNDRPDGRRACCRMWSSGGESGDCCNGGCGMSITVTRRSNVSGSAIF